MAVIQLEVSIKFRAMGITFGNWHDKRSFPIPPVLSVVLSELVSTHIFATYDDHGVKVVASVVKL